jgi:hypothetical protein
MDLNKEDLKREIETLEKEVFQLGRIIINSVNSNKVSSEDVNSEDDKKEQKIQNQKLKELKTEQKIKNEQLKIYRSIYTNLLRELKTGGTNNNDTWSLLFDKIKELQLQSNMPAIQQNQDHAE